MAFQSDNDKSLIEEAEKLNPIYWSKPLDMTFLADSDTTKNRLREIAKSLYHREEGNSI